MTMSAPASASPRAMALPSPLLPPVTSATLPVRSNRFTPMSALPGRLSLPRRGTTAAYGQAAGGATGRARGPRLDGRAAPPDNDSHPETAARPGASRQLASPFTRRPHEDGMGGIGGAGGRGARRGGRPGRRQHGREEGGHARLRAADVLRRP